MPTTETSSSATIAHTSTVTHTSGNARGGGTLPWAAAVMNSEGPKIGFITIPPLNASKYIYGCPQVKGRRLAAVMASKRRLPNGEQSRKSELNVESILPRLADRL
jgi:hypothetical protein